MTAHRSVINSHVHCSCDANTYYAVFRAPDLTTTQLVGEFLPVFNTSESL